MGQFLNGVSSFPSAFFTTAGCAGLPFTLNIGSVHKSYMLFAACDEPMAGIASTVRNVMAGVIGVGAFLSILRYIAQLAGFGSFGGGGDSSPSSPRFRETD